jgi:hypothetical protein
MKISLIALFFWLTATVLTACPVCDKRQPKGFAGIIHGTGPEGLFDYWMLYGSIAIVVLTFMLFVWFAIKPDHQTTETAAINHRKRTGFTDWNHG